MGQQTSTADRPPAGTSTPRRVGPAVLAATTAIVTLLGATGAVWWTTMHHLRSGAPQASSLFVDSLDVFDADPSLPPTQVSTATVTNTGQQPVTITDFSFTLSPPNSGDAAVADSTSATTTTTTTTPPPTVPLVVFPGENCKGATLQPQQNCMISVKYNNPGQVFFGTLNVITADESVATGQIGANNSLLDSILADPYVVDFGARDVGTTSPAQTVTIGASPDDVNFQIAAVSVVDTVPTPGDRNDYTVTSDGCTGQQLQLPPTIPTAPTVSEFAVKPAATAPTPVPSCAIQVTDTPGGAGPRPAFLSVAYCSAFGSGSIGGIFQPAAVAPESTVPSDQPSSSDQPTTTTTAPPPPDPNVFCPPNDGETSLAFHQIIALNGTGLATTTTTTAPPTTTTTTPPTTTTTTPPTTTTSPQPQNFIPTLTAIPPLAPAGRTTLVSGAGFPVNTQVTFALVALGTAPTVNLAAVPGAVTTTTDNNGTFANQVMLIMPHVPPGQYEILAQAQFGKAPLTAMVGFLVAPGSQEPPKFAFRH